jgi:hypothetical protein
MIFSRKLKKSAKLVKKKQKWSWPDGRSCEGLVLAIISASALTASAIKREGTSSFESSIYFLFFAKEDDTSFVLRKNDMQSICLF